MTMLRADLAALFAPSPFTVPVRFGASVVYGYFDSAAVSRVDEASGMAMQGTATTCRVRSDAWSPMPTPNALVLVGREGDGRITPAARAYRVREVMPDGDGLETVLVLVPA